MRPYLERLPAVSDASWSMLNRRLDDAIPFQWHHHPEFELTLTLNSQGQRFIGDHVGIYDHADLVLIGPNLPHTWASRSKIDAHNPHVALVFWFRKDWIERAVDGSVEMQPVGDLIGRAKAGLAFSTQTGLELVEAFETIFAKPPLERLVGLFSILGRLADDRSARPLSQMVPQQEEAGHARLERVLTHLHQHYSSPVSMAELAAIAALSLSGLHRMFLRHTRTSVSDYVTRLRIGEASSRLSSGSEPIGFIAEAVGYPSLANFNRQFKALRGMTPRAYRSLFSQPLRSMREV